MALASCPARPGTCCQGWTCSLLNSNITWEELRGRSETVDGSSRRRQLTLGACAVVSTAEWRSFIREWNGVCSARMDSCWMIRQVLFAFILFAGKWFCECDYRKVILYSSFKIRVICSRYYHDAAVSHYAILSACFEQHRPICFIESNRKHASVLLSWTQRKSLLSKKLLCRKKIAESERIFSVSGSLYL